MRNYLFLTITALGLATFLNGSSASAQFIAGWEQWASGAGVKDATQTDGFTTATTLNNMGNNNGFGLDFTGNTDGTWGTLADPNADATTDENSDGYRLTNGEDGSIDFMLTDTSGIPRDLNTFHFDTATWRPNAANDWELSVISGDLTVGSIATGNAPNVTGGTPDWSDFDIDLTGLADNTLDGNGSVTFRLNFTGGVLGSAGHHQSLDNVAISGDVPTLPPSTLLAGWDVWESDGVISPSFTEANTTGFTSNNGGVADPNGSGFGLDFDGNTDGTWGTLDTPAADTTTDDNMDVFRLVNGEDGSLDFTITDTGGVDRDLAIFHFDSATLRPNSSRDYELSIVAGDLTLGTVATGTVPSLTGGVQDWTDFDIVLTNLADFTLDANGSVTFRLQFTGSDPNSSQAGHHQYLDNVGISELAALPGDFDFSGVVDGLDFLFWQVNLGDAANLTLWENNYGNSLSVGASTAVPEPSSAALLTLLTAGVLSRRRHRRIH